MKNHSRKLGVTAIQTLAQAKKILKIMKKPINAAWRTVKKSKNRKGLSNKKLPSKGGISHLCPQFLFTQHEYGRHFSAVCEENRPEGPKILSAEKTAFRARASIAFVQTLVRTSVQTNAQTRENPLQPLKLKMRG